MSDTKDVTITRKIELNLHGYEGKDFKEAFDKLYKWRNICFNAANLVATHCFHQEQTKQFFYYTENVKVKLADVNSEKGKDSGILTTSKQNSTYQLLSSIYKGQIPMSIMTSLNSQIVSSFNKEKKHYFSGERSLRNYKSDIPIPIQASDINKITEGEHGNYYFTMHGLSFRTNFGKDLSGNKIIFERSLQGEYKLCDSSIQVIKKNGKSRIFLLAVFQFDKLRVNVDPKKVGVVKLDFETPLILQFGDKVIKIGSKQEFIHRRLAIQAGLRRTQIAAKYNKGGKGIQKKIAAIERYKESEISYVSSRIHKYSAELINLCIKYKIGTIILENMKDVEEKTKEENNEFLLRNWSYFGLREKISYKSNKFGITLQEN
jgi:IS605 OrfB family transposase